MESRKMPTVRKKMVVVGDSACGKTSLVHRFSFGWFLGVYTPTIVDVASAEVEVGGTTVELFMWDTSGEEGYDRLRPLCYHHTDVVLVVFAFDRRDSLENVAERWVLEARHFMPGAPIVLVGNKTDLKGATRNGLVVRTREAWEAAEKIEAFGFHTCSAKTAQGVQEVLITAAKATLRRNVRLRTRCRIL